MSTNRKVEKSLSKNNQKKGKRESSLTDKNDHSIADELSLVYQTDPIDHEKAEAFRRIASAEEIEELDACNASSDDSLGHDLNFDSQQRARLEQEWRDELAKIEDEVQTLRQVLLSKVRRAEELKRRLKITVWKEFRDDMEQGIKNIQETAAYQKTSEVVKKAGEKTTSIIETVSGSVVRKLGEVKNSSAFKSLEERVGSAVTNVRTKITGSKSNSFSDSTNGTTLHTGQTEAKSPTIQQEKPSDNA